LRTTQKGDKKMPLTKEGTCQAQIKAVTPIEPRFPDVPQPAFELMFNIQTEYGEETEIYLEFSGRLGKGNNAQKTQSALSAETLHAIGYAAGADFSRIGELVGKVVNINVKKSEKGYYNAYFSTYSTTKLDPAALAARVAAMTVQGSAPSNPFCGGAQAASAAPSNPLGGGSAPSNPFAR